MTLALALASTALVVWAAWEHRPAPARARRLRFVASEESTPSAGQPLLAFGRSRRSHTAAPASVPRALVERLGRKVRGLLGRPSDPLADRRLGTALLVGIPAALISAPLGLLVAGWWWFAPVLARRRAARRVDAALLAELPEVVDLFVLAVGSGLTVALAVPAVARHHRGLLGDALTGVARQARLGRRLGDALAGLPEVLGERVRPLTTVLVSSERYGVALVPALERLAAETRLERRRAAEATARRVPVKLLFPLVLCTLPAFALLTVVPLLAGSLRSLRL